MTSSWSTKGIISIVYFSIEYLFRLVILGSRFSTTWWKINSTIITSFIRNPSLWWPSGGKETSLSFNHMETAARKLELHKASLISTHLELVFNTDTLVFWFFQVNFFAVWKMPVCINVLSSIFMTAFYEAGGVAWNFVLMSFLALSEWLVMKYKMMRSVLQWK